MKCIDCKIKMKKIEMHLEGAKDNGRASKDVFIIYKCPRCFVEIEKGDEDYEWEAED